MQGRRGKADVNVQGWRSHVLKPSFKVVENVGREPEMGISPKSWVRARVSPAHSHVLICTDKCRNGREKGSGKTRQTHPNLKHASDQ